MRRRDFFKKAGIGSATLVSLPALAHALTIPESAPLKPGELPANTFSILLRGTYKRVVRCPDLGLLLVNPCDGSYSTTKIFAVSGLPEKHRDEDNGGNRRGDRDRETEKGSATFTCRSVAICLLPTTSLGAR